KTVRVKDLASHINVKAPSVHEALAHLRDKGLVVHERYGYVDLTPRGLAVAQNTYRRHLALKKFFMDVFRINARIAENDACAIEHYLSKESTARFIVFMSFVESSLKNRSSWLEDFYYFIEHNRIPDSRQKKHT
ncbi:MAG: hypothetical protein GF384_02895, partial [Elusimicrobia bacterium]|nr:hypothetical protein [Elusimicrobiota bacterium]MBD3411897.1 hypothetical protein [Elusimicrobiota bacterium]